MLTLMAAASRSMVVSAFRPIGSVNRLAINRRAKQTRNRPTLPSLFSTKQQDIEWTTDRVRSAFIDFFQDSHDHTFYPSSPCAPLNDPTLLFTNAGMNQFKPIFLGQADPQSPLAALKRAVNSQKCIRAGGKHNDLDDVGRDTYHHTYFEMLGTWSFGDYFKKEAIDYAWELLTQVYKLDPERLYATYFEGNDQLEPDFEARDYWLQYLPASRVIGCGAADNFWEMGETGPCGPCSELHYDRIGGGRDASALVNADDPDVIEIWNLVFMQYNRVETTTDGQEEQSFELQTLPAQHIDTGMGLERVASLLQGHSSNYDIDCFQPLFAKLAELRGGDKAPYQGRVGADDADFADTAYRAIADHARTLSFAIADGAVPNNEGRGYVLRRILRRAVRYGSQVLECPPGFMTQLVPIVVQTFGKAFPELVPAEATICDIVAQEEASFGTLLERGIKYFGELRAELEAAQQTTISGEQAFFLYDTLGFPLDLTELMAEEAGLTVDAAGFAAAMQTQKERSRQAQKAARQNKRGDDNSVVVDLELQARQTAWLTENHVLPTDDSFKYKWDDDEGADRLPATVLAIYGGPDVGFLDKEETVKEGDYCGVILDKTSFYAEAGGQEADWGSLELLISDDGSDEAVIGTLEVTDVQTYAGFVLHQGTFHAATSSSSSVSDELLLQVGSTVLCRVNYDRRRLIAPNHSMTHVLNAALRQVLQKGSSDDGSANVVVDQRGSLCNDEKLRFDFTYKKALSAKQLKAVETFCQTSIEQAEPVSSQVLPLAEAQALDGVRAVFGEVYPDPVRVISIGGDTSIEFCGGTHLENTAEAQAFCLVEETAVAKGIRRITALTQQAAQQALALGGELESQVATLEQQVVDVKADSDKQASAMRKELDAAVISAVQKQALRQRIEAVQNKIVQAKKRALQQRLDVVLNELQAQVEATVADGDSVLVATVDIGADGKASQRIRNAVKTWAPGLAFMGLSQEEASGKLLCFASVPAEVTERDGLKANEWVQASLESCNGRGGGKPDNAQGQAAQCDNVERVVEAAATFARQAATAASKVS